MPAAKPQSEWQLGTTRPLTESLLAASLLHESQRRQERYGMIPLSVGGGMDAGVIENLTSF